jgi:uncharacterized membrane protein YdjX (TVP38/TMEM64 family)
MSNRKQIIVFRIIALALVIAITVFIFSIRTEAEKLALYGYPGAFLLSFLAYATVVLPAPGVAFIFTMGTILNPVILGIVAGAGAALGEITGYMAGFSGQAVIERADIYLRLTKWMNRNGPLTILILSAIPNPFFDLAGAIAGALRMPLLRFLIWCWMGESIKMMFFSLIGASAFNLWEYIQPGG